MILFDLVRCIKYNTGSEMPATTKKRIFASEAITRICRELGYTRAHVAKTLRENVKPLGARVNKQGRWVMPPAKELLLKAIVKDSSGRRYKLGEKGPHA